MNSSSSESNRQTQVIGCILSHYKTFNRSMIIEELDQLYQDYPKIHLEIPQIIQYISRKHGLPEIVINSILKDLTPPDIESKIKLSLSQALKYEAQKQAKMSFEDLLNVMKNNPADVQSEIVWAIGYKIQSTKEKPALETIEMIEKAMHQDITVKAKSFLKSQISKCDSRGEDAFKIRNSKENTLMKSYACNEGRHPKAVVTKNQQSLKISHRENLSHGSKIDISTLTQAIQNRKKQEKIKIKAESLPKDQETRGSDMILLKGTYNHVRKFYISAMKGNEIKVDDKDTYLLKKFVGPKPKYFCGGMVGCLFADMMIAEIFAKISKKQKLSNKAIEKVFQCIGKVSKVKKMLLGTDDEKKIKEGIACQDIALKKFKNEPKLISKTADSIYTLCIRDVRVGLLGSVNYSCDFESLNQIIDSIVNKIRLDTINTIYNCCLRDINILTADFIVKLQNCLQDQDLLFKNMAIKILSIQDKKEIDYKNLFDVCLGQLEQGLGIDYPLDYIMQQTRDKTRCMKLFNESVLFKLSNPLKNPKFNVENKLRCCEIVNSYLQYEFPQNLNERTLENFSKVIEDIVAPDELKYEALVAILLNTENTKKLPYSIIHNMLHNIVNLDNRSSNLVIMILELVCERNKLEDVCEISFKLLDDDVIINHGNDISFEPPSKKNSNQKAISTIAGDILISAIEKSIHLTPRAIDHLLHSLESCHKQTRIRGSKALSLAAYDIEEESLPKLREYLQDIVPDVAIYTTDAYLKRLVELSKRAEPISGDDIESLPSLYADKELILEDKDFSQDININILAILENEAIKQPFSQPVFEIFDYIFVSDVFGQKESIEILEKYVTNQKGPIPKSTIAPLEGMLYKTDFSSQTMVILEKIIQNGQEVNQVTLDMLKDHLYRDEDEKRRSRSFKLLETADMNQDLPDDIFKVIEMERAAIAIDSCAPDEEEALHYLDESTKQGSNLTITTLKILSHHLDHTGVLRVLKNITENQQTLPEYLLDQLVAMFEPEGNQIELVEIFINICKNSQNISREHSVKFPARFVATMISPDLICCISFS